MPRGDLAGFPTYWTSFGQGPRAALMIHCSLAHSGSWGALARHLSGALSMTAFDMPGHGRSGAWDQRGEYQQVSTDIAAALCDQFGDAPVDVVGHSFGATVALRLAVEHPRLVRSLVLIEPVFFAAALQDNPAMQAQHEQLFRGFAEAMAQGDAYAAANAFTDIWGDGTPWEALPEAHRDMLASQIHLIEAGGGALHDDPGGMLNDGVLERLTQSVLLVEGSASPRIIPAIHERLAARISQSQRLVVAGAGHMVPITHAAQVSDAMLRFYLTS